MTTSHWQPCREPFYITLMRTGAIALVVGALLARPWNGLARWPGATLLVLWPSFGGHWVEIWFLNWLRRRLPNSRLVQVATRIGVWFVGGGVLALGMALTIRALGFHAGHWSAWGRVWWLGGLAFIGVELVVHFVLVLRGRASFYDGRG